MVTSTKAPTKRGIFEVWGVGGLSEFAVPTVLISLFSEVRLIFDFTCDLRFRRKGSSASAINCTIIPRGVSSSKCRFTVAFQTDAAFIPAKETVAGNRN